MNVMSTFHCFQKHDDILKSGSNKYIILYYTQNNLYSKIIKNQTFITGPGIQYVKFSFFYNLNIYLKYWVLIKFGVMYIMSTFYCIQKRDDVLKVR